MEFLYSFDKPAVIKDWNKSIREGSLVPRGQIILTYEELDPTGGTNSKLLKLKLTKAGVVKKLLALKGDVVKKGTALLLLGPCPHPTVISDMCAECGMDLRKLDEPNPQSASVSMVHSVPDLRVSMEQAQQLGKVDEDRLLAKRKLVLLVDLDQTLIHTTNDDVPNNLKDVFHFQLWGHGKAWYHTRIRPHTHEFLEAISNLYELHICTFGTRHYAHTIAQHLDSTRKLFSDRILSRDECFSQNSKTANLKELFPRGDHMVCIIDDREDVWNFAPNLIHVKPYHFFRHTGDINAPPGLSKKDQDDKTGFQFKPGAENTFEPVVNQSTPELNAKDPNATKDDECISNTEEKPGKVTTEEVATDLNLSDEDDSDNNNDSCKEEAALDADMEESNEEDGHKDAADTCDLGKKISNTNASANLNENLTIENTLVDSHEEMANTTISSDSQEEIANKTISNDSQEEIASKTISNDSQEEIANKTISNDSQDEMASKIIKGDLHEDVTNNVTSSDLQEETSSKSDNVLANSTSSIPADSPEEIITDKISSDGSSPEITSQPAQIVVKERTIPDTPKETEIKLNEGNNATSAVAESSLSEKPETLPSGSAGEGVKDTITPKVIEVEDPDDYLLYLQQILVSIHDAFYSLYDDMMKRKETGIPDVKTVIPYVRKKVMTTKNINIVFSGVVPTHVPLKSSKAYQIALSLGAHVSEKVVPPNKPGSSTNIEPPTTHVVAARMGTAKVNEARRYKGIHIVTPEWLWSCAERWEHVDEKLFRLDKAKSVKRNPPAHCSSPEFQRDKFECITPIDGPEDQLPSTSKGPQPAARKERTPSGRFMDTINPLLSFSPHEIDNMAHEVDDICNESESSSSDNEEEAQKEKERAARRRSSRSLSGQDHENTLEPSSSELTKESSSSESSNDSCEETDNVYGCNNESYHKKRKREPKTETETEDEPLSVKFRRGEPLPSDIDSLNLMNSSSDNDDEVNEDDEWMAQALEREFLDENSQSQDNFGMR